MATPFLELPREIRDIVYLHFFSNRPSPTYQYNNRPGSVRPMYDRYTQDEINLCMTCRQLLHETHDALFHYNTIEIRFSHLSFPITLPSTAIHSLKLSTGYDGSDLCLCKKAEWAGRFPCVACGPPVWLKQENMMWKDQLPSLKHLDLEPGYFANDDEGCRLFYQTAQRRVEEFRVVLEKWNPGCEVTCEY